MSAARRGVIGRRLADARAQAGLSQSEVARRMGPGFAQVTVSSIEAGVRSIKADELEPLADILCTTVAYLAAGVTPSVDDYRAGYTAGYSAALADARRALRSLGGESR